MDRTPPHVPVLQSLQLPQQLDGDGTLTKDINTTEHPELGARTAPCRQKKSFNDKQKTKLLRPTEASGKLNNDVYRSSGTEVGVLTVITGHGPTPPEGGTYHQRRK
ncbi:hypothetical protein AVEN_245109-1 [Araneus ventricosus]|uniref:Uncharacterized protein n=1 Tax=Araneus ventricosus TaxID=182803 RepID=A0A4Y2PGH8_ARAVE|nr:hypothetical protein AVEN_245109-1 [Araneus ventricosus]